jgi:hypothetical protein
MVIRSAQSNLILSRFFVLKLGRETEHTAGFIFNTTANAGLAGGI